MKNTKQNVKNAYKNQIHKNKHKIERKIKIEKHSIKRPILIASFGYIIGIIIGLYFKFSIAFFYIPILASYKLLKSKIKPNRYIRYVQLFINSKVIYLFIIASIISNGIVLFQNNKYDALYKNINTLTGRGIIVSEAKEKEYKNQYKIKIININKNTKFQNTYLIIKVDKKQKIEYGDEITFSGEFSESSTRRNYGGFDYKEYLKTIKAYGTVNAQNIRVIQKDKINGLFSIANKISTKIKQVIDQKFDKENAELLKGILLGDCSNLENEVKDDFRASNISHILAVSGMHIAYLVMGINLSLKKLVGKNKTKIAIIIVLTLYMFITGFTPSVVRACIMEILVVFASLIHRKPDVATSLGISVLSILIYNPYLIMNIGLQFSYLGTIGILYFHKNVLNFLKEIKLRDRKWEYFFEIKFGKIINKIREILAVTISAQIAVLPISIYHFNLLGTYFLITNLLVSPIIGITIILGIATVLVNLALPTLNIIFSKPLEILLQILVLISKIGELPYSKIYLKTPTIYVIIIYYIAIIILNFFYAIFHNKRISATQRRARNLIALAKYKLKKYKRKPILIIFILIIILVITKNIPKKLEINFVDVGQGDCTFITTPTRKTILIDGGGSISKDFDVGKSTLLPYILDKGCTSIDYVFISHFDQDHVGGILYLIQEIKVKNIFIPKQFEDSENYQKFIEIIKNKKIKVIKLEAEKRINIEKNLYFDVLWPKTSQAISENSINNNALVCKLNYKKFSMLFTGDIEQEAEKVLIENYKNTDVLKSTILKVGHHGSKSSTTPEFLDLVQPKISLIGVGKNNMYGHPNEEIIDRLKNANCKIYRTDENGEIDIQVTNKQKLKIKKLIEIGK